MARQRSDVEIALLELPGDSLGCEELEHRPDLIEARRRVIRQLLPDRDGFTAGSFVQKQIERNNERRGGRRIRVHEIGADQLDLDAGPSEEWVLVRYTGYGM